MAMKVSLSHLVVYAAIGYVVAVLFGWLPMPGGIAHSGAGSGVGGSGSGLSALSGVPQARVSVSSVAPGKSKDMGDNNYVITLTSADLSSNTSTLEKFNVDLERIDTIPDANGAYPIFKIKCGNEQEKQVDGKNYYTVLYDDTNKLYNYTIGGASVDVSNKYGVNVALPQGSGTSKEVDVYIPSTSELNEFAQNVGDTQDLMKCEALNNAGEVQGTITVRYVRTE